MQLGKCDELCAARQAIVERYNAAFKVVSCLEAPHDYADRKSAWHLYILRLRLELLSINRDQFISELKKRGIGTSVHFIPLHLHPFYQNKFGYKPGDFPNAESEYRRVLSLPLFPTMSDAEINAVIAAVAEVASAFGRK